MFKQQDKKFGTRSGIGDSAFGYRNHLETVFHELSEPTLRFKALAALLEYITVPKTEQTAYLHRYQKQSIFIWPMDGVALGMGTLVPS